MITRPGSSEVIGLYSGPYCGSELCYFMAMKQLSIQDLKAQLSSAVAEAESGNTIVITRHNTPVAKLIPAEQHIHRGKQLGKGIRPAIKVKTRIPYLQVLNDDRGER
jgi:prevent-host-death family protein